MPQWRMKANTVMQYVTETSVIIRDYIAFSLSLSMSNYVFLGIAQRRITLFLFYFILFFGRILIILHLNMLRLFATLNPK